ncbi:MAG: T9SS type A sorting domain-containing protein, partial [Flavobacteriales bacterium]
ATGCLIVGACNYNPTVGINDSTICTYPGCNLIEACNYSADAGCIDIGLCILPNGCIDVLACNYSTSATCDDGSCVYANSCGGCFEIEGCTDISACNFDATASCDDSSCIVITTYEISGELIVFGDTLTYQYPADPSHLINWSVNGGGAIISGQGTGNIQVVWQASGELCVQESIDADCSSDLVCIDVLYIGIDENLEIDFMLYPNPSGGIIHVESNVVAPVPFVLLDALGKPVLKGSLHQGRNDLNLEYLSAGSYLISTHATNLPLIIVK